MEDEETVLLTLLDEDETELVVELVCWLPAQGLLVEDDDVTELAVVVDEDVV